MSLHLEAGLALMGSTLFGLCDQANDLIRRARCGSRSALGTLLDDHRPLLTRMAREELRPGLRRRMSDSDLVQDTLLTASDRFPSFEGETSYSFRAWLSKVFHSRLRDGIRRHRGAQRRRQSRERIDGHWDLAEASLSAESLAILFEESERLSKAIVDLDPPLREVLMLRYWHQWSFERIATHQNVSVATVWRQWSGAVDALRYQLK